VIELIKSKAKFLFPRVQQIRRHIHTHPELSFQEFNTSAFIVAALQEHGIEYTSGIVKTGIVATIKGKNPDKKIIALRADMDALPITEKNEVAYKSKNEGVMHACGHDVHTACLLGAAMILNELRSEWEGTVKLIFQPGEEVLPGGAKLMIEEGILENSVPERIIAQHVFPAMPAGKVGFREGMYMASTDEIHITIHGKGGHAAMPAEYVNPLLAASRIVLRLDEHFMRTAHKDEKGNTIPCVLAFGKIVADGATNVIPEVVELKGTFRTMNETWREKAHQQLSQLIDAVCAETGTSATLRIEKGYPFLVNDPETTKLCRTAAIQYLGPENVEELPLRMTAEDFAWFSQRLPACFYRLGTGNLSKGITSGVHTPIFDIDETALEIGSGLMAWTCYQLLAGPSSVNK
jgi:amidohydrolase